MDVDPSKKSPDCIYDANSCKNPDRFKFILAANGTIIAADPMGRFYLRTRKNWLKTKGELDDGGLIAALDLSLLEVGLKEAVEPSKQEEPPTPEPEPEPEPSEPDFNPNSVQVYMQFCPLNMVINNFLWAVPREIALGAYVKVSISDVIPYNVKGGISLQYRLAGVEYYRCTIPAGKTECVTPVLNPLKLQFNNTDCSIYSTYAWIEDSDYTATLSNIRTEGMELHANESNFKHSGVGYSFSVYKGEGVLKSSDIHKMAVLSGHYTKNDSSPVASTDDYLGYSEGQKWFFNDVDPELLTDKTEFPN